MVTPKRPIPISSSTSSSASSARSGRTVDSVFDLNVNDRPVSPITPSEERAPNLGKSKRPPGGRRSANAVRDIRSLRGNEGTLEVSDDGDPPSPIPVPKKNRRRPGKLLLFTSSSSEELPATQNQVLANVRRRTTSLSPMPSIRLPQQSRRYKEDDEDFQMSLQVPGAYQSSISEARQRSVSAPETVRAMHRNKARGDMNDPSLTEVGEDPSDCDSPSNSEENCLRPKFVTFKSKGTSKRQKDTRSINFLILECLKTASKKKKKKTTPGSNFGCIYVLEAPDHAPNHMKVGKSNRDPMERQKEWEKCGVALKEVQDVDRNCFDHYDIVESLVKAELHNLRRQYKCTTCDKTHNEWFETDKLTVLKVVSRWRNWTKKEQPFDENWNLTPYWKWKVDETKTIVNHVNWDRWTRSSTGDRLHYDYVKPYFERKDSRFQVVGTCVSMLFLIIYGRNCALLGIIGLLCL